MIRLNIPREPFWIDLPHGIKVKVRPLTTAAYEAARSRMGRIVRELQERQEQAKADGYRLELPFDPTDRDSMTGYSQALFVRALATGAIVEWSGAPVDGIPVTPENVADLMDVPAVAEAFIVAYVRPIADLATEGNASAPAPSGTTAGAPNTADGVGNVTTPVPAANAG